MPSKNNYLKFTSCSPARTALISFLRALHMCFAAVCLLLAACGGSGNTVTPTQAGSTPTTAANIPTYSIESSVSGLIGTGLVLSVAASSSGSVAVSGNGNVRLASNIATNTNYAVSVLTQPSAPAQTCTVSNGTGKLAEADVTNVTVSCAPPVYSIAANVSGLTTPGLVLVANVKGLTPSYVPIATNGTISLETGIGNDLQYSVDISMDPTSPLQICTVANGNGTTGSANEIIVAVNCVPGLGISVTISGLSGQGLALGLSIVGPDPNDGASNGPYGVGQNGVFTYPATLVPGDSYRMSVVSQPTIPSQTCTIENGTGVVSNTDVTNVQVTCSPQGYAITGNAFGLSGNGLILQLNGSSNLSVPENGFLSFPTGLPTGTSYTVTIASQPTGPAQTCTVNNGRGTVGTANISNLQLICLAPANGNSGGTGPVQSAYLIGTPPGATANSEVLTFPSNAGGTLSPGSTLAPTNATDTYVSVATDTPGNIYVGAVTGVNGQESNPRILVFSPGSSDAATPLRTLQLAGTPDAIAVDAAGNIYASSRQSNTTYEYPLGANGNTTPTRTLARFCDQLVIDLNANLLCASDWGGGVAVFGPTQSGNTAPARTIYPGAAYVLDNDDQPTLVGLTVDAAGDIFIGVAPVGDLRVDTVFKATGGTTSNDQGSPVASVTAALKGANFQALQFDATGNLYILEPALTSESILWRFAPQNGDFTAPTSEGISAAVSAALTIH